MRLKRYPSAAGPDAPRLFCFPYGGGGMSVFNTWPRFFPGCELWSVELPGRDSQISAKPHVNFAPFLSELHAVLKPALRRPHFYFGHSLGALVAYELARAVRRDGGELPAAVLVSAHPAPHLPNHRRPLHHLPDPELIRALAELNGTPKAVFQNPELLELMLPLLRADFELHDSYHYTEGPPLPVPIVAFAGSQDAEVNTSEVTAWARHTSCAFSWYQIEGDHFFIHSAAETFVPALGRVLGQFLKDEHPARRSSPCRQ